MFKQAVPGFTALFMVLAGDVSADEGAGNASAGSSNPMLSSRHTVSLGFVDQKIDASIRATVDGFDPVGVDLKDLGVDDNDTSYYVDYRYRFKPRWTLVGGVYSFAGSGGRSAERTFNFDGVEYEVGTAVRADFDIDAYIVDVMYTVHSGQNFELLLGGGLHALDLGATITAAISVGEENASDRASGATLLAPVPNFRASGMWALSDRLSISAVAGWLSANIDEYSGSFIYGHVRAVYGITDSLGVALGYQRTDIDVTQDRERSELSFEADLYGPTLTLTYSF